MTSRLRPFVLGAALLAIHGGPASAQLTAREAAVAIDRIDVPSFDVVKLDVVAEHLRFPWSVAFLPDGSMLITEKRNGIRLRRPDGTMSGTLPGAPPNVLMKEDSGLLDIVLDPDFVSNRTVYIAFAEGDEEANRTAIWKARLSGERLVGGRVIFRVNVAKKGTSHPGGRLLFLRDKTLLLTVGDGFEYRDAAQDMRSHLGKVLRLTRDGAPASGNPFLDRPDVAPEIWTSGHRNIQGLTLDPATGLVWAHEHGPRGGDEVNQLEPGRNYGWPRISYGIDYDGTVITERAVDPRFERPRFYWAPSIAPSGLTVYRGSRYSSWDGRFFVGALAARGLVRLSIGKDTPYLVEEQRMLLGLRKRIRDVRTGPDGLIYLLTDEEDGSLLRIAADPRP